MNADFKQRKRLLHLSELPFNPPLEPQHWKRYNLNSFFIKSMEIFLRLLQTCPARLQGEGRNPTKKNLKNALDF
jgi:hypothetical protein